MDHPFYGICQDDPFFGFICELDFGGIRRNIIGSQKVPAIFGILQVQKCLVDAIIVVYKKMVLTASTPFLTLAWRAAASTSAHWVSHSGIVTIHIIIPDSR